MTFRNVDPALMGTPDDLAALELEPAIVSIQKQRMKHPDKYTETEYEEFD